MNAKLWWRFRTQTNLWSNYLWNKYCKKQIPTLVGWRGGSQVWKAMLEDKEKIESFLWWEPRSGTSTVWFDNWTNFGPIFLHSTEVQSCHPINDVGDFFKEDGWDYGAMQAVIPEHAIEHARDTI